MQACRNALIGVGLFSAVSNILMLTGSVFMLEVYDRVLPSRSVPTLIGLCVIAAFLFAMLGILDLIRSRIMVRIGASLDEALSGRVYETLIRLPLKAGNRSDGLQPLRDLDSLRSFLSGSGPIAFFDLPWLPVYLAICFIFFHFWIGMAALGGAIILVVSHHPDGEMDQEADAGFDPACAGAQRACGDFHPQRRGHRLHGHDRAHRRTLGRGQPALHVEPSQGERRGGRARRDLEIPAHDDPVRRARGRRLARHQPAGLRRHHHRRLDPVGARAGAGRSRHRQLEGLPGRPPGLGAAEPAALDLPGAKGH